MGPIANSYPTDINPAFLETRQLLKQYSGVNNHPVSQYAKLTGVKDSGRDQVEFEFIISNHNRMPGIIATLKSRNQISLASKKIGNLPFTFVTPLQSYNNH
jgi:hypothetical protein